MSEPELNKPFAGFDNFDACLAHMHEQGYDEETSRKICGKLQAEAEGKGATPASPIWKLELHGPIVSLSKTGRVIAGYANMAVVDREGDLITVDAWEKAAKRFMASGFPNINLKHGNVTIGEVIPEYRDADGKIWKTHVDDNGFFVVAKIRDDIHLADQAWQLIEQGRLREFSISGNALPGATEIMTDQAKGVYRKINDLELYEVTVCERGVNPGTGFMMLKSEDGKTLRFQKQERPPKEWWDRCVQSVSEKPGVDDPAALCGWIWYHQLNQMQTPDYDKLIGEYKALPPSSQSPERDDKDQKEKGGKLSTEEKKDTVDKQTPPAPPAAQPPKELGPAIIEKLDALTQAIEKLTALVAGKAASAEGEQKGAPPSSPPATPSQEDEKAKADKAQADTKKFTEAVQAEVKKQLEALAQPSEKRSMVPGAGSPGSNDGSGIDSVKKALDEGGWDSVEHLADTILRKSREAPKQ